MNRIVVIGDVMLDTYWHGTVDRISPEAPVPVLSMTHEVQRPGGAANVAANIAALGCECWLYSAIGADDSGRDLSALLDGSGVQTHLDSVPGMLTTRKIRPVAGRHHLARIDLDGHVPSNAAMRVIERADAAVQDIVVLSDYAHGMLQEPDRLMKTWPLRRTLVDPKGTDWGRYSGAWLVKPNKAEMQAMIGPWADNAELRAGATRLCRELKITNLLVTLGEAGMVLISGNVISHFVTDAREVYDVCGAGDTVIATIAAMLARGYSLAGAIRIANRAAGIVVGRFGASTVTLEELGIES